MHDTMLWRSNFTIYRGLIVQCYEVFLFLLPVGHLFGHVELTRNYVSLQIMFYINEPMSIYKL